MTFNHSERIDNRFKLTNLEQSSDLDLLFYRDQQNPNNSSLLEIIRDPSPYDDALFGNVPPSAVTTKYAMQESDIQTLKTMILEQTKLRKEMEEYLENNPNTKMNIHNMIVTIFPNISQCYTTFYQITKEPAELTIAKIFIEDALEYCENNQLTIDNLQDRIEELISVRNILSRL